MLSYRAACALQIALAFILIPSSSFALTGLFWTEDSGGSSRDGNLVVRSDLDFSNQEVIHNFPDTTDYGVRDVAVDETRGKLFWVDIDQGRIMKSNLDGTQIEEVVNQLNDVRAVEIDPVTNKLYFIQSGLIQRADTDSLNSNIESLHLVIANTLSLDRIGEKLYWSAPSDGKIQRSNLDGSNPEDVVTGLGRPLGVHVAPTIDKVFWTDNDTDSIGVAGTAGINQDVVLDLGIPGLRTPSDVDYDISAGVLFWVDSNRNFIQQAEFEGMSVGAITTLSLVNPNRIHLVQEFDGPDPCAVDDFEDGNFDGWTLVGVGHSNQESALVIDDGGNHELALTADGATAYYGRDNTGFLYQELTGDFRIETMIDTTTMITGKPWRKAGLMARAGLDDFDIRLLAMLAPIQQRLQFVAREVYGGPGNVKPAQEIPGVPLIAYLAIERAGQTLTVQYSFDGVTWTTPDNNANHGSLEIAGLPPTLFVGPAVVSNDISVTSTALFDDVSICPAP